MTDNMVFPHSPERIRREYVRYVSQNILGMLGISCYIIVDTFFIAQAAGAAGIAVLNLCLPLYNMIYAVGALLGVGSATWFSILRAQNDRRADEYLFHAVLSAVVLGLPFMFGGLFCPDRMLGLMGGNEEAIALGVPYARIFLTFAPFFMLNQVFSNFVRNDNSPMLGMLGTIAGSLFNIVFDYIFMFPMGMGMAGAALATGAAPLFSIIVCSLHLRKKENHIRFRLCRPRLSVVLNACKLGISAFVGELSQGVTTMVFNFLILGFAGNIGIAAYGIIANLSLVVAAIFNGIASGSQPLISDSCGRGDRESMRQVLRYGILTAVSIAAGTYLLVYIKSDWLIAVFNSEGSALLHDYAFTGLRLYFLGFFFAGINIVATGYFSASNQSVPAAVGSLSRGIFAITGCAVLFAKLFGLNGVWAAFPGAEVLTLVVMLLAGRKVKTAAGK